MSRPTCYNMGILAESIVCGEYNMCLEDKECQNEIENALSKELAEIDTPEINILITDRDKYGKNLSEIGRMSDFLESFVYQQTYELSSYTTGATLESVPIAEIGIINEVFHQAEMMMKGQYGYIPDFQSLPHDIKTNLRKGIYKIAQSKQVDGNVRAVILDENDVRIKDITLKRVKNDIGTLETARSITNQLQMRQIYNKLDSLQELQSYQIDRDRDRDIRTPFLTARDHIRDAQETRQPEEQQRHLRSASDLLKGAINSIYTDLDTSSKHLEKLTKFPLFQKRAPIEQYVGYLAVDLQLLPKFIGMQAQVLTRIGNAESAKSLMKSYESVMRGFFVSPITAKGLTAAMLIHQNYPYTEKNMDCWYRFAREMESTLQTKEKDKEIYLLSVEDMKDEV